ncbi:hypothetical protein CONCODRAFT_14030 [Conidiobolus coronatus NRRL 28638]|uniref:Uncharacterized protein n=1 Tax=Conidiobolus coronatus (strain ATCC 28846 / CBS 209.66 / NRRL 28638) TaxID=796925 RepID=A0A137NPR9_CONC2|nr:hypothetical protein CONCODRAFT_14030 [Conidiobolus coronatus NRRL 28638]|eukprot:KXN64728.1 hypothetical protein CONCODRAFT_14030 [Conidiobolus coronatus NRRL 28638]
MSLENNQKQGNSDLLELPPPYSEVEASSTVPVYQNNGNGDNSSSSNSERDINGNYSKPADRDCHPASFLFGIPIIGLLASIVVGLGHSFRGHHHHGHHENHWSYHHHSHHRHGHYYGHHHDHHHGFDMNPFNNHHHHHHSSHMNPFGY